jgi:hypothetical protein
MPHRAGPIGPVPPRSFALHANIMVSDLGFAVTGQFWRGICISVWTLAGFAIADSVARLVCEGPPGLASSARAFGAPGGRGGRRRGGLRVGQVPLLTKVVVLSFGKWLAWERIADADGYRHLERSPG